METLPRITVITVVRNAEATLERAIESLIAQAYPNLEFLVLDAASTDGTPEIIRRYEPHIAHWRSHADGGPNAAYNEGIERASGDIIALLNADDWYEPGILLTVGEAYRADPSLDMVTCEAKIWRRGADGNLQEMRHFRGKSLTLSPEGSPMPNARFFRKSVFTRFGPFETENHAGKRLIAADLEHLLRLSQHSLKNRILPQVGYHYLMHEGSQTMGKNPERERQMYDERAWLAERYLAKKTLRPYARRLKRWHRRGTVRAFLYHLRARHWNDAFSEAKRGIRVSHALWLADAIRFFITPRKETA